MSAHRVMFVILGNDAAVRRVVRRMLDDAGFTQVPFTLVPATEDELVERECFIRVLEGAKKP